MKVTPTRLATGSDRPRRCRMTYLDRPRTPRGGAQASSTPGAVVHLPLRTLFGLPPGRRARAAAAALADRGWSGECFRDTEQAATRGERARLAP